MNKWKKMNNYGSLLLLICGMSMMIIGCSSDIRESESTHYPDPLMDYVGKTVTVQFNRNDLGGAADIPVSPTTDRINGAETSISGMLKDVTEEAILVKHVSKMFWIPKDSILLLELPDDNDSNIDATH